MNFVNTKANNRRGLRHGTVIGTSGLALALALGGAAATTGAYAASPVASTYQGTTTLLYAGDNEVDWDDTRPLSFEIDADATLSGLTGGYFWTCIAGGEPGTTSFLEDSPIPATPVDADEPFTVVWQSDGGGVEYTFEGVISADGSAEGLLMADLGVCGASILSWEAQSDDAPDPTPLTFPQVAPTVDDLEPAFEGAITVADEAEPGDTVVVEIAGMSEGAQVGVWLFSEAVYLGTHAVDAASSVLVTVPADAELGEHRIGVWNGDDEQLVGWSTIAIVTGDDNGNEDADVDADAAVEADADVDASTDSDADTNAAAGADADSAGDGTEASGPGADHGDQLAVTGGVVPASFVAFAGVLLAIGAGLLLFMRRAARS